MYGRVLSRHAPWCLSPFVRIFRRGVDLYKPPSPGNSTPWVTILFVLCKWLLLREERGEPVVEKTLGYLSTARRVRPFLAQRLVRPLLVPPDFSGRVITWEQQRIFVGGTENPDDRRVYDRYTPHYPHASQYMSRRGPRDALGWSPTQPPCIHATRRLSVAQMSFGKRTPGHRCQRLTAYRARTSSRTRNS